MARLAEQAERYQDMFDYLTIVVKNRIMDENEAHFTRDERNLLSHAFKNMIVPKRYTWRHLNS